MSHIIEYLSFEERIPQIQAEINKKRFKWRLSSPSFEDVSQMIILRIFVKYHLYDPKKGPFINWLSRSIGNAFKNILRQNYNKYARPCVQGCVCNLGGDYCSYTKSKIQCEECPLYADWKRRKGNHHAVEQVLTLEHHSQEVSNMQSDFVDIDEKKKLIDKKMKEILSAKDYKLYKMLYIDNLSEEEVGSILNYKKSKNHSVPGYQLISKNKKKFIEIVKKIIQEDNLA